MYNPSYVTLHKKRAHDYSYALISYPTTMYVIIYVIHINTVNVIKNSNVLTVNG